MSEEHNTKKFSDFSKNTENPFLLQAIQEINNNAVKKYRSSTGTDRRAVLQAIDPDTGETLGYTSFIRQIEVDEQEFVKFYLRDFKVFYGLSEKAIKIFGYILKQIKPNSDEFFFYVNDCIKETGYKTKASIYAGLTELITNEIIARGRADVQFFINPMVIFNGNRITFAKTYVKKKAISASSKALPDATQLDLFE